MCIELWVSAEILQRRWDCRGGLSLNFLSLSLKRTETESCVWWVFLFLHLCLCFCLWLSLSLYLAFFFFFFLRNLFPWLIIQSKFFGLVKDSYDPILSMQRRTFFPIGQLYCANSVSKQFCFWPFNFFLFYSLLNSNHCYLILIITDYSLYLFFIKY